MSHLRIDDYLAGIAALALIFAVVQVALYAGRHHNDAPQRKN